MRFIQFIVMCIATFGVSAAQADFTSNWLATPKAERNAPEGHYEGRILERMVTVGNTVYPVGNIVYLKFPKREKFNPADFAEKVRVAMGFEKWHTRRQRGAYVFESQWASTLRFVRMYVKEEKDSISYSVAVFRMAYMDSVVLESELIQRRLAGVTEGQLPWLEKMFTWVDRNASLFAKAYAEGCPVCTPGDTICMMSASSCNEAQMVTQMQQFNNNIGQTNTQLGIANGNWSQTNSQLATANGQLATANANWAQTNQVGAAANKNWADTNKELHRSNDLLQNFMKPENAFLFAAATAAGAAVGAMAVSLAVDALVAGGKAIYEAITHEQEEAKILERFKQAREVWEKTSLAARDLEKVIDSLLYLKTISKSFGLTREQMIEKLGVSKASSEAALRRAKGQLDEATNSDNAACIEKYSNETAQLTDLVGNVSSLRTKLQDPLTEAAICTNLKQDLGKLTAAEGMLQKARASILGGHDVWLKSWGDENEQARKDLERARSKTRDIVLRTVKMANADQTKALDEQNDLRSRYISACMAKDCNFLGDIPLIGLPIREGWRPECSRKFDASPQGHRFQTRVKEINKAHDSQLAEAGREYNQAKPQSADEYFHNPTMVAELRGYDSWFDQVRDEQACLSNPRACTANGANQKGMMTRFNALAAKGKQIDEVCNAAITGAPTSKLAAK